jgi:hypothetical protein
MRIFHMQSILTFLPTFHGHRGQTLVEECPLVEELDHIGIYEIGRLQPQMA